MEHIKKVELLAPAGSIQAFYGAVSAGADAVYLGGTKFGARAYAENFTEEELVACIRYGCLFGVKVYLTVNTLLKEQELEELSEYLKPLCKAGLRGVIVQDLGVLSKIRAEFPTLELHASTQMTLCTSYGVELLKAMGVSRIVPARELSLEEVVEMKRRTGLELETFIHGAMCYCYSGQCLFSSILGGRSGNRGRCAQPCRLPYRIKNKTKEGQCYPLSLKDMCTIDHIPALVEAGIDSFKIEGRMKKPEYAAGVTAVYRKYIDHYYKLREKLGAQKAAEAYHISEEDREILSTLYVRNQLQDGYYFKKNGREMVTLINPAYSATGEELLERIRRAHLQERPKLKIEAEAEFLSGKPARVILRYGKAAGEAIGNPVEPARNQPITEENINRQLSRLGDSPFAVSGIRVLVSKDIFYPLKEINELRRQAVQALEEDLLRIAAQADEISDKFENRIKTDPSNGNRPIRSMSVDEFRPAWSIAIAEVLEQPVKSADSAIFGSDVSSSSLVGYAISVRTMEQFKALEKIMTQSIIDGVKRYHFRRIYVDGDLLICERDSCLELYNRLKCCEAVRMLPEKPKLMASLPHIFRKTDKAYMEDLWHMAEQGFVDGFLVRSLDELGFLSQKERANSQRVCLRTDAGVYVWNSETIRQLFPITDGLCLPYELKASEQYGLLRVSLPGCDRIAFEKVIYGRIPMMVTANCLQKTLDRCVGNGEDLMSMEDRTHTEFPVLRNCMHCYNIIYNSVPLALLGNGERWKNTEDLRLDFTIETGQELKQILQAFLAGKHLSLAHTTGHEKRGVE